MKGEMKMKSALLAVLLTLSATHATANPEVIVWHEYLNSAFSKCRGELNIAHIFKRVKGSSDGGAIFQETRDCVSKGLIEGRSSTQVMLSQEINPKVRALVKDFYAAWTSGMKEIPELLLETEGGARAAALQIQSSLNKSWALIELELN